MIVAGLLLHVSAAYFFLCRAQNRLGTDRQHYTIPPRFFFYFIISCSWFFFFTSSSLPRRERRGSLHQSWGTWEVMQHLQLRCYTATASCVFPPWFIPFVYCHPAFLLLQHVTWELLDGSSRILALVGLFTLLTLLWESPWSPLEQETG